MSPNRIRLVDYWIGRPLCALFTLLRYVGRIFRPFRRRRADPPTRILIVKLIEQGATVVAYRALERAAQMVGRENVFFLVFQRNRAILDLLGLIPGENVIVIRDDGPLAFVRDTIAALWRIRRLGIDAAVDMEFFSRASALLTFLSGARLRAGLHRFSSEAPYRGNLFTHRVLHNPHQHVAIAYYLLVDSLRAAPDRDPALKVRIPNVHWAPPPLDVNPPEQAHVRELLEHATGQPLRQLVLLNANAGDLLPLRRWPTERFVELGKRLLREDPELTIAITGAPSEATAAEEIVAAIGSDRAVCMAGKTDLRQLVVLCSLARALVTNDSGPAHFASLSNTDIIVLFGPETPLLFGPLGPRVRVISASLACSPCVSALNHRFSPCHDNQCMQEISTDEVFTAVTESVAAGRERIRPKLTILTRTMPRRELVETVELPTTRS